MMNDFLHYKRIYGEYRISKTHTNYYLTTTYRFIKKFKKNITKSVDLP